jgi:subtilisin
VTAMPRVCCLLLLVMAGCAQLPTPLTGDHEYIITVPLGQKQTGTLPSAAMKVYLGDPWEVSAAVHKTVRILRRRYALDIVETWPLASIDEYCIVVRLANRAQIDQLREDTRVSSVQEVQHFVMMRGPPSFGDIRPWQQLSTNVASLARLHQWATGEGVRVGLIDTAVDVRHPDLEPGIARQEMFVCQRGEVSDLVHGTAVAGVIAARPNNGVGMVGFAPDVQLTSYAACYHRDDWGETVCDTFSLAKALAAASEDEVQLINMSLSGPEDRLLSRLIEALSDRGVIVVAAENADDAALDFPASMPQVIAVGKRDDNHESSLRLLKTEDEHLTTRAGGNYQFFYGSSMSAARVTALIALLLQRNPDLSEQEVREALLGVIANCHGAPASGPCAMKFALTDSDPAGTATATQ